MRRFSFVIAALLALACALPPHAVRAAETTRQAVPVDSSTVQSADASDRSERFRLRIVNRRDGAIQVSTDGGAVWRLIGRVLAPATTVAEGYTAAQYAVPGTVAATAVHGIRVRVGADDSTLHDPLILSIDPIEYQGDSAQNPDKGYGGQVTGSAGILTDIHAGTSLFRELSPMVGNMVSLEKSNGTEPLPAEFRPKGTGETLIICVTSPRIGLTEVTFENRRGGPVIGSFSDGTQRELTRVVQPLLGVGRFDGTAYTGVGRVNTNHTGVITVSTSPIDASAPEGVGRERRGGFQISPAWHNARLEEAGAPMVMTLGSDPAGPRKRELEGVAPLFLGAISLGGIPDESAQVDIAVDGRPWESMPSIVGNLPAAFTAVGLSKVFTAVGKPRGVVTGATAFRLRLSPWSAERSLAAADAAVERCRTAAYVLASRGGLPIVKGVVTVNANPTNARNVTYVRLLVEDAPRGFTNVAPFALTWNTMNFPDGEYLVEADALDTGGAVLAVTRRKVFVLNHEPPKAAPHTTALLPGLAKANGG